jgi:hypothetical protein
LFLGQIEQAVKATGFHQDTGFSWFGTRLAPLGRATAARLDSNRLRQVTVAALKDHLYLNFYCRGAASPLRGGRGAGDKGTAQPGLVLQLSAANRGQGTWNGGWRIEGTDRGMLIARSGDLTLRVPPEDCRGPAEEASVRFPKEFPQLSAGFYLACGDRDLAREEWAHAVRLYWNATPAGAVFLMGELTAVLNQAEVPFRFKVVTEWGAAPRCDAAVLYLRSEDYRRAVPMLERAWRGATNWLRDATPALTRPLAPGLGLAEEPTPGPSFGLNRCLVLAEGMVRARDQGRRTLAERMAVVAAYFAEQGIDLDRPYLNRGSADIYEFPRLALGARPAAAQQHRGGLSGSEIEDLSYLETAHRAGHALCRSAIWSGSRCNWLGSAAIDAPNSHYGTLGSDLYSGTAGIALFLGELYGLTGDRETRRTAEGALAQALSQAGLVRREARAGLYAGWAGMALVCARLALLWGNDKYLDASIELLRKTDAACREAGSDMVFGKAGALIAFLAVREIDADGAWMTAALRLGQEIAGAARRSARGYSWKTTNAARECHLTGLSHGAAGIARALVDLYEACRDPRYRTAVEEAFRYERYWFSPETGNWADLRGVPSNLRMGRAQRRALPHIAYWCHGAPGIALSRLRAHAVLGDGPHRDEALLAIETTRKALIEALDSDEAGYSLCHGVSGNAEVLHIASRQLDCSPGAVYLAADTGMRLYARTGGWPAGGEQRLPPGLMTGLAGIGHFYLRLCEPEAVPPVLTIGRRMLERPSRDHAGSELNLTNERSVSCPA